MSDTPHNHAAEYCSVCGAPADAAWHGNHVIAVCSTCAIETLPSLIADAIYLPKHKAADAAKRSLERVDSRFWRALTLRLFRSQEQQ